MSYTELAVMLVQRRHKLDLFDDEFFTFASLSSTLKKWCRFCRRNLEVKCSLAVMMPMTIMRGAKPCRVGSFLADAHGEVPTNYLFWSLWPNVSRKPTFVPGTLLSRTFFVSSCWIHLLFGRCLHISFFSLGISMIVLWKASDPVQRALTLRARERQKRIFDSNGGVINQESTLVSQKTVSYTHLTLPTKLEV